MENRIQDTEKPQSYVMEEDDEKYIIDLEDENGSECGSDSFEKTVGAEYLKFLEKQEQKMKIREKCRAWSAPARPMSLSSPNSASQKRRSAEKSMHIPLADMQVERLEYVRVSRDTDNIEYGSRPGDQTASTFDRDMIKQNLFEKGANSLNDQQQSPPPVGPSFTSVGSILEKDPLEDAAVRQGSARSHFDDIVDKNPGAQQIKSWRDGKRPPKPLAYFGILGVQGRSCKQAKWLKKTRPPSAPSALQQGASPHTPGFKQALQQGASPHTPGFKQAPPSHPKKNKNKEIKIKSIIKGDTDPPPKNCTPRAKSANHRGQPISYFDLHLKQTQPSHKLQTSQFVALSVPQAMMQNTRDAIARVRASACGLSGAKESFVERASSYSEQQGKGCVAASKKHRMQPSSSPAWKSSTESIYTKNILGIIAEANRNSQKTNSKYRYCLDEKVYGSYDVHIRVFDTSSGEWLNAPWTMKRFLGKHTVLKEKAHQNRFFRAGCLSARVPKAGSGLAAGATKSPSLDQSLKGPCTDRDYRTRSLDCGSKMDWCCPTNNSGKDNGIARKRSLSPNISSSKATYSNFKSELEHIESLCRGVSKQVKLAREIA